MRNTKITSVIFAILLLFSSCTKDYLSNGSILETTSEEDVFKSIFFLSGPLVDKLPTLKSKVNLLMTYKLDEKLQAEFEKTQDDFLQTIKEINPNYLMSLKSAITNNDPYVIAEKISEGGELMLEAIKLQGLSHILQDENLRNILNSENINLENYDFNNKKGINRFFDDISAIDNFNSNLDGDDSDLSKLSLIGKSSTVSPDCVVAVALVVAVAFIVGAVLAAVEVVGVVNAGAFVNLAIHINVSVAERGSVNTSQMENNLLITDLVNLK